MLNLGKEETEDRGLEGVNSMMNYDGFDFSPYLIVTDIKRPILPPQRISSMSIFGRDGAYFFRKQHDAVVITVSIIVKTDFDEGFKSFRERIRFLAQKLNKDEPKPIIFFDEDDRFINGIITDETDLDEVLTMGQGDISFYCPDPFYYAVEDEVFTFLSDGSHDFTRQKGNIESYPKIEIQGLNDSGNIEIVTDNTTINYSGKLNSGEILVLDSDLITASVIQTDGSIRSAISDIDNLEFPVLSMGANNITVNVSGGASIEEIKVSARSRWI